MDNYNSLREQLIQNGFIDEENFFRENDSSNPFEEEIKTDLNSKRLNIFELDNINKDLDNFKNPKNFFDRIIYYFFPKIYKAQLVKRAMEKFLDLNIDPKILFDKTIPYGEADLRYKDLVKYLKYASKVQAYINNDKKV